MRPKIITPAPSISTKIVAGVGVVALSAAAGWFYVQGATTVASTGMDMIEQRLILDAMQQLNTALPLNDPIRTCVYAQQVTAAMIMAKDSVKLAQFAPTEKRLCKAAGL